MACLTFFSFPISSRFCADSVEDSNMKTFLTVTTLILVFTSSLCLGQTCEVNRKQYANITNKLLVGWDKHNEDEVLAARKSLTIEAAGFIRMNIVNSLNKSDRVDPQNIANQLQCWQNLKEYQNWHSLIDLPKAFYVDVPYRTLVVAYFIYRGPVPAGIPDTLPFVDFFRKLPQGWKYIDSVGEDFKASTFEIYPITSGLPNQTWFLLSGHTLGDTGAGLKLEIISFDGEHTKVLWQKFDLTKAILKEIRPSYIIVSQYQGFANGHDINKETRWDVTASGLKPIVNN